MLQFFNRTIKHLRIIALSGLCIGSVAEKWHERSHGWLILYQDRNLNRIHRIPVPKRTQIQPKRLKIGWATLNLCQFSLAMALLSLKKIKALFADCYLDNLVWNTRKSLWLEQKRTFINIEILLTQLRSKQQNWKKKTWKNMQIIRYTSVLYTIYVMIQYQSKLGILSKLLESCNRYE